MLDSRSGEADPGAEPWRVKNTRLFSWNILLGFPFVLKRIYFWSGSGLISRASFVRNSQPSHIHLRLATLGRTLQWGGCRGSEGQPVPQDLPLGTVTLVLQSWNSLWSAPSFPSHVLAAVPALLLTGGKWEFTITKSPRSAATAAAAAEQASPCVEGVADPRSSSAPGSAMGWQQLGRFCSCTMTARGWEVFLEVWDTELRAT